MSSRPVTRDKKRIINKVASREWYKFRDDREYDKYRLTSPTTAERVHLKGHNPFTLQIKETDNWSTSRQATWRIKSTLTFSNKDKAVECFFKALQDLDVIKDFIDMEKIL